jgi:hypothetical protein
MGLGGRRVGEGRGARPMGLNETGVEWDCPWTGVAGANRSGRRGAEVLGDLGTERRRVRSGRGGIGVERLPGRGHRG